MERLDPIRAAMTHGPIRQESLMNRMSFVFCVSTCLVAVALSSFALFQNGPSGAQSDVAIGEELRELQLIWLL